MKTKGAWTHASRIGGGVVGLLAVGAILAAVNIMMAGFSWRRDLTEEKLYSLSPGTRRVLQGLDRDVSLKLYFSRSAPQVAVPLKNYARQVADLLREYERTARGRVRVEEYDPAPDSDAEEWAQRYGIEGQPVGLSGETLYFGLVVAAGDQQAVIPVLDPRADNLLEYHITRMIHRVANPSRPVVGVMSPLPVLGLQSMPFGWSGSREPAWAAFQELSEDYEIRSIPLSADRIDDDVSALVVVHPKQLSPRALYAIDQFVLRGGRLVAFLDPLCLMDENAPSGGGFPGAGGASDLGPLPAAWGIQFNPRRLAADLAASTPVRGRNNQILDSPVFLSLRREQINDKDVLTAPLENLVMPMAGFFSSNNTENITLTPLVQTSPQSDAVDVMAAQFDPEGVRRRIQGDGRSLWLAVRAQGRFRSAFPDGPPESTETNAPPLAPHLAETVGTGTVVLVADVDMLHNEFCVREINFFGYRAFQPINDNASLLHNAVEQAAGSADLIGIRCRGQSLRPFTRVQALARQAQMRWLQEERNLEQKLRATQARLDELQAQKDEKQRFILSPEQEREIQRFRQEMAEYRRELRNVRKNLREDIERLGTRVKAVNILLMPGLVAISGIIYGLLRRARYRS